MSRLFILGWPLWLLVCLVLNYLTTTRWGSAAGVVQPLMIAWVTASIILVSLKPDKSLLFRVLNLKVLTTMGAMSYSIYLWQQLVLSPSGAWVIPLPEWSSFPINILLAFILGWLGYLLIEVPFLRIRRVLADRL